MRYLRLIFPLAAVIAGCGDSTGLDGSGGARSESFAWSGQIAPAATVEVRNINGDVHARPGTGGTVRVHALKQGAKDDPSIVRIEVVQTGQGVTICAVYPDVPGQPPNRCESGPAAQLSSRNNDVSVTFDIEVPPARALVVGTVAGAVDATDLTGHVSARTVAGNIDISTSATADAATINGDITVSIGGLVWDRDLSFTALAGDVMVRVPALANADVHGSTRSGSISTDFSLDITRLGDWQQLSGRLGSGGRNLAITTSNGDIALLANQRQPPSVVPGVDPR